MQGRVRGPEQRSPATPGLVRVDDRTTPVLAMLPDADDRSYRIATATTRPSRYA
jgi:hypothetical protein